jgi:hypothetical protein
MPAYKNLDRKVKSGNLPAGGQLIWGRSGRDNRSDAKGLQAGLNGASGVGYMGPGFRPPFWVVHDQTERSCGIGRSPINSAEFLAMADRLVSMGKEGQG